MRNVILLGLVSFFADVSTEMVYPLVPLYLTAVLGATPALVGVIEGAAESTASLLKVFSGYWSDRTPHKKHLAFLGYAAGVVYKGLLLLAGSWGGVLAARLIDRVGKGVRTAPRDVMVAESARQGHVGQAFGLHKTLDMAGAGLGVLLAWLLLGQGGGVAAYRSAFLWSIVPGLLGLTLFLFIRERKDRLPGVQRQRLFQRAASLDRRLKLYLGAVTLFTLGNSSNAFLLLRSQQFGFTARDAILLYLAYHVAAALLALPLGRLSDRVGRKSLLVGGYILFSAVYALFAWANTGWMMWAAFSLYGLFTAMTAGVERAFIAEIAPADLKGTMLGLHGTLTGVALFGASAMAGLLWTRVGPQAAFLYGALLSLLAAVILALFLRPGEEKKHD